MVRPTYHGTCSALFALAMYAAMLRNVTVDMAHAIQTRFYICQNCISIAVFEPAQRTSQRTTTLQTSSTCGIPHITLCNKTSPHLPTPFAKCVMTKAAVADRLVSPEGLHTTHRLTYALLQVAGGEVCVGSEQCHQGLVCAPATAQHPPEQHQPAGLPPGCSRCRQQQL